MNVSSGWIKDRGEGLKTEGTSVDRKPPKAQSLKEEMFKDGCLQPKDRQNRTNRLKTKILINLLYVFNLTLFFFFHSSTQNKLLTSAGSVNLR